MTTRWWSMAGALVLLGACGGSDPVTPEPTTDDDDSSFATDGTDANAAENDVQLLASSLVSSSTNGEVGLASVGLDGSDLGTRDVGDGAVGIYLPRGCVIASQPAERKVTYTFAGCLGPAGLRNVTGSVTATYRIEQKVLKLDLAFADLGVNEATVSGTATAEVTSESAARTMRWNASVTGTTARGRTFTRTSTSTIGWTLGEACYALDGSSEGDVRNDTIKVVVSGFRRCRRGCPDAGGTITVTKVAKSRTITLAYDGSNEATFTNANGVTRTVALLCRP